MTSTLLFASNNNFKADEIRFALNGAIEIITLQEAGFNVDIPEPHETLEDNAREKSAVINRLTGKNCFSEDTGLEVYSLNGEPGVKSARYSGDGSGSSNIKKLLGKLINNNNREARFRTIISLFMDNNEFQFEGICEGQITLLKKVRLGSDMIVFLFPPEVIKLLPKWI